MAILDLFPGLDQLQVLVSITGAIDVAHSTVSFYSNSAIKAINPLVISCLTIYISYYAYLLMSGGAAQENLHTVSVRVFKFTVVWTFTQAFAMYNKWIAEFFWNMPEYLLGWFDIKANFAAEMVGAVTGAAPADVDILLLSGLLSGVVGTMEAELQGMTAAGNTSLTPVILSMGTGLTGAGLVAVTAGILLMARISLAVLLAVGPIFFLTILFEKTKHFFDGWLAQVTNFTVLLFLMSLTIHVLYPLILIIVASYYAIAHTVGMKLSDSVELMTLLGIFIGVINQVPSTAAALVRGYQLTSPGSWGFGGNPGKAVAGGGGRGGGGNNSNQQAQYNNVNRQ